MVILLSHTSIHLMRSLSGAVIVSIHEAYELDLLPLLMSILSKHIDLLEKHYILLHDP